MRPPMTLRLGQNDVARIVTYDYETPWATGRVEPLDANRLIALIAVCEFRAEVESWPEVASREDDDARWLAGLRRRGLTEADVNRYDSGPWTIETGDGVRHEIHSPVFDRQGFVMWRW